MQQTQKFPVAEILKYLGQKLTVSIFVGRIVNKYLIL